MVDKSHQRSLINKTRSGMYFFLLIVRNKNPLLNNKYKKRLWTWYLFCNNIISRQKNTLETPPPYYRNQYEKKSIDYSDKCIQFALQNKKLFLPIPINWIITIPYKTHTADSYSCSFISNKLPKTNTQIKVLRHIVKILISFLFCFKL